MSRVTIYGPQQCEQHGESGLMGDARPQGRPTTSEPSRPTSSRLSTAGCALPPPVFAHRPHDSHVRDVQVALRDFELGIAAGGQVSSPLHVLGLHAVRDQLHLAPQTIEVSNEGPCCVAEHIPLRASDKSSPTENLTEAAFKVEWDAPSDAGLRVRLRDLDLEAVPIDVAVLNLLHFTLPAAGLQRADDAIFHLLAAGERNVHRRIPNPVAYDLAAKRAADSILFAN